MRREFQSFGYSGGLLMARAIVEEYRTRIGGAVVDEILTKLKAARP